MPRWFRRKESDAPNSESSGHLGRAFSINTRPSGHVTDTHQSYTPPSAPAPAQSYSAPSSTPAENQFLKRGNELLNEGSYADATFMYSEALREQPDNAQIHYNLSIARSLTSPPQIDQALADVDKAIQINPAMGQAWKQKGDLYMQRRDYEASENAYVVATNMLKGMDRVQAQQALALAKSQKSTIATTSIPQILSAPVQSQTQFNTSTTSVPTSGTQPRQGSGPGAPRISIQPAQQIFNPTSTSIPSIAIPRTTLPTPAAPLSRTSQVSSPTSPQAQAAVPTSPISPPLSPPRTTAIPASPITPAAGLAAPPNPSAARSPSPLPTARGEALAQELEIPTEAPPVYSPTPLGASALGALGGTSTASTAQLNNMMTNLATRRQGSLYIKPYTTADRVDSVQLQFYGRTYIEAILMDLPPATELHDTWKKYHVSTVSYPGTTFIDYDCETQVSYDGYHNGTISVHGYTEEYREYQLSIQPPLELFFEAQSIPPVIGIEQIVARLQLLKLQPYEDNTALSIFLGGNANILGLVSNTSTAWIQNICTKFHRGQYDAPHRFIDFLTTGPLMKHVFGTGGIGLTNFLFHMLLGYELYIRLLKGGNVRYPNIMRATTSAIVVIAHQWMNNVTIRRSPSLTLAGGPRYTLGAINHAKQAEGLLRFAEAISWPYMDSLRQHIENAYSRLIINPNDCDPYLRDWLYGLSLPGRFFRHQIMCCLVAATPATKHIGAAPYYESGLVVGNKAYWSKRSVLGAVLGGLSNPKSTCGWIGPVPAPATAQTGWYRLSSRLLDFTTPVVDDLRESSYELLGFSDADGSTDPLVVIRDLTDMTKWVPPKDLPERAGAATTTSTAPVRLQAVRLQEVISTTSGILTTTALTYRALLDFNIPPARIGSAATVITFTLYTSPVFVHVPKCAGATHPIPARLVKKHFDKTVLAKDLKSTTGASVPAIGTDGLMIIDSTEAGEEALARAWCAETGRHAVVRKSGIGCFTCAVNLAQKRTGLGFGVLIWCK